MFPKFIHDYGVCDFHISNTMVEVEFYNKDKETGVLERAKALRDAICKEWDIVAKGNGSLYVGASDLQDDFPCYNLSFEYYKPQYQYINGQYI